MAVYDVPAAELIQKMAGDFKKEFQQPAFVPYVKTGVSRERAPISKDWWFVRTASILYRVYKDGPVGTESLRSYYGGRKNRGLKPERFRKASGKVIRTCLQALEKGGYLLRDKAKKGRMVSPKAQSYLEKSAAEIQKRLAEILKQREEAELKIETQKQLTKEEQELREAFKKQKEEEHRAHEAEKKKHEKPHPQAPPKPEAGGEAKA